MIGRRQIAPPDADRRTPGESPAARLASSTPAATLAWGAHAARRQAAVTLIHVGASGAMAFVRGDPPTGVPAWLRIESARSTDRIEGSVVESVRLGPFSRWRRVRLQFTRACPDDILERARGGVLRGRVAGWDLGAARSLVEWLDRRTALSMTPDAACGGAPRVALAGPARESGRAEGQAPADPVCPYPPSTRREQMLNGTESRVLTGGVVPEGRHAAPAIGGADPGRGQGGVDVVSHRARPGAFRLFNVHQSGHHAAVHQGRGLTVDEVIAFEAESFATADGAPWGEPWDLAIFEGAALVAVVTVHESGDGAYTCARCGLAQHERTPPPRHPRRTRRDWPHQ